MKDIYELFIALTALAFMLLALAIVPVIAFYSIPFFVALGLFYWWKNSPSRLEKESRKHTYQLYEAVKARQLDTVNGSERFDEFLATQVNDNNRYVIEQLKDMYLRLWWAEGYGNDVPEPPPACNSIEGGKYRDFLNRYPDNNVALEKCLEMAGLTARYQRCDVNLVQSILNLIYDKHEGRYLFPKTVQIINANYQNSDDLMTIFDGTPLENLRYFQQALTYLPDELRVEHHHILAGTGSGKTQAMQQMILNDLEEDASIVVVDSQGKMISNLATRISTDRLILIDPEFCPPAINLFGNTDEKNISSALELYEYIFKSLDAEMTSKQQTAYRFVCRLLMKIPNANIHTMRQLLEPKGTYKYQKYIDELGETTQAFFKNEYEGKEFAETKHQILRRLYTVLENTTLEKMLSATESKLNIDEALNTGKVILVSTNKGYLKQMGATLFGRIYIAQVMQSIMARKKEGKRVYLYMDEFQDYADDSYIFTSMFDQGRKFNIALVCAHQYLAQLPPKLEKSMSTNTSIKFAYGLSAEDYVTMAKRMHTTPDFLKSIQKGQFACYLRGLGATYYNVEFGRLEKKPKLHTLEVIHSLMTERYGVPTPPPPEKEEGSGEVVEDVEVIEEKPKKKRKSRQKKVQEEELLEAELTQDKW